MGSEVKAGLIDKIIEKIVEIVGNCAVTKSMQDAIIYTTDGTTIYVKITPPKEDIVVDKDSLIALR